ncbi:MAG: hypothetical protein ABEI75_00195 [Halobaculum sp.]
MQRRTLLRRLGATGIGVAATATGTSSADSQIQVSELAGEVRAARLVRETELTELPAGVSPTDTVGVAASADRITLSGCCEICCVCDNVDTDCDCYTCQG